MKIEGLEIVGTEQDIYDGFNSFILSPDLKVFGKLMARTLLLEQVKDVPGDIVECGVFKGTGVLTFLKLKRYYCPNSSKKVIGFDFFDSEQMSQNSPGKDGDHLKTLFEKRGFKHEKGFRAKLEEQIKLYGFGEHEFELIEGDISQTAPSFVESRPGFRVSFLYIDLDVAKPTYDTLKAMWDRVSRGGIVVFDEYAYHNLSLIHI
nr:hypothetical protein 4 [bacterium]